MSFSTEHGPCKWAGGNDYLACMICGVEYDYRKAPRPACGASAEIARLRTALVTADRRVADMREAAVADLARLREDNVRLRGWLEYCEANFGDQREIGRLALAGAPLPEGFEPSGRHVIASTGEPESKP